MKIKISNSIESTVFKSSGYKKNKIKVNHLNYTPKEKAEDIIEQHQCWVGDRENSLTCAYITVLEVISALNGTDLAATWGDYWEKVKAEIKEITERECGAAGKNYTNGY